MMSILLGLGLMTSPALAKKQKPCWVPSRMSYSGRTTLAFTSVVDAIKRENGAAKMERREAREIRAPWLVLHVERLTLEGADPSRQLILVEHNGEELMRYEPPGDVPSHTEDAMFNFWWSYAVVQLPEGVAPPFEVSAVDRLHMTKCIWSVDAAGVVVLTDKIKGIEEAESRASEAPQEHSERPDDVEAP